MNANSYKECISNLKEDNTCSDSRILLSVEDHGSYYNILCCC